MSNSEMPIGWSKAKLGDVCELVRGVSFSSAEKEMSLRDGYVACLRTANVQDEVEWDDIWFIPASKVKTKDQFVRPNDILISTANSRELVGKVARVISVDQRTTLGAFISAIRPIAGLDPKYLFSILRSTKSRSAIGETASTTTNISNLSMTRVLEIEIPVAPVAEQERIAAKLDELLADLAAGVSALERARANLKRYRAAVLKAAVEGRLTEKWRAAHPGAEPAGKLLERILAERRKKWEEAQLKKFAEKGQAPPKGWKEKYVAPAKPDVAALPALPEGWCWASVGQVAEIQGGIQKQPTRAPKGNAFPYLRVGNVLRDRLDLSRIERFELADGELDRLRLEAGDLLVVEGNGSRNEIGRAALWRGEIENCVHQNHIIRVRFKGGLPEFLSGYWNSPPGMARVAAQSASTSGLYTLSVGKVSDLPIPLPPLLEQREIVAEVDKCCSNLEHNVMALEVMGVRSSRLRQSILKRAFEGKLVPQDPKDEPASELLARIRAERLAGKGRPVAVGAKGTGARRGRKR
jgi:type I restriction enzyme S subunit